MGGIPENIKKKLAETTSKGGGAFLGYGQYVLMLKRWFYNQGYEGTSCIHEFVVLEAKKKVVQEGDKTVDREPNAVDSLASHVVAYYGPSKEMADQKVTDFFLALYGVTDEEVAGYETGPDGQPVNVKIKTIDESVSDKQPCKGMILNCDIYPKEKKNKKGEWLALPRFIHIAKPGDPEGVNSFAAAAKRWADYEARLRGGSGKTAGKTDGNGTTAAAAQ